MQQKTHETQEQKLNRWKMEREAWKCKPISANQDLTQEQMQRYWKERKSAGFSDY
jgi:hypothetical protein